MAGFGNSRILRELNEEQEWEIPTSMIDVVFLLLIFFMCASKFRTLEQRLDAYLPKDKGPQQTTTIVKQLDEITIYVDGVPGYELLVPQFRIKNWKTNNPDELAGHLAQLGTVGDMPVVINGEQNCPFKHVMTALDACARAKLTKVEFRAPPADI